ncbi:MAG: right-handed parallel beta-helix repeat-containing protein, partial [Actinomycetes bacterium]
RAGDWGIYLKGGSAYFTIEGNEIYDCLNGGFSAGQGTGFEYMVSPWLHYEATDIKFVNNVIHDTEGAGMGVNGGYNILLAWNTLYRVGRRSHAIEIVHGARGCDGDTARCLASLAAGGWGTAVTGDAGHQPIPNRNVFIFNNLLYNPDGYQSAWNHFALPGPVSTSPGSNIPSPALADDNVVIRGNVLWNGAPDLALGIGEEGTGGQPGNPVCTAALVLAQNAVNTVRPIMVDPEHGDYRLTASALPAGAASVAIPAFAGGDRPARPLAPEGELLNTVTTDITGSARSPGDPPGAWRLRASTP